MRSNEIKQAKMITDAINRARCELINIKSNSGLSEWEQNKREFELCQAIDLLKSDMVDLVNRMLLNHENQTILKEAA